MRRKRNWRRREIWIGITLRIWRSHRKVIRVVLIVIFSDIINTINGD
jgi:hypothetical protein